MKRKIAVVCGGFSGEYEISLKSGSVVHKHLTGGRYEPFLVKILKEGWSVEIDGESFNLNKADFSFDINGETIYFDGVFIAIHGHPGENGVLQGYFDMLNIPYNSGSVFNSGITFQKKICNDLLKQYGVKSAESFSLIQGESVDLNAIEQKVGFPCFVKPNKGGSSIGISKVRSQVELEQAIPKAFNEDDEIIIESFIKGTEVTCGVISFKGELKTLGITEIVHQADFFDYEAKYNDSLTQEITPARITEDLHSDISDLTQYLYKTLSCKGMIRVDYIVQDKTPFLIEINTVPGLSEASIVPKMAGYCGLSLQQLFENECDQLFN